jgi:hypothetical protein
MFTDLRHRSTRFQDLWTFGVAFCHPSGHSLGGPCLLLGVDGVRPIATDELVLLPHQQGMDAGLKPTLETLQRRYGALTALYDLRVDGTVGVWQYGEVS